MFWFNNLPQIGHNKLVKYLKAVSFWFSVGPPNLPVKDLNKSWQITAGQDFSELELHFTYIARCSSGWATKKQTNKQRQNKQKGPVFQRSSRCRAGRSNLCLLSFSFQFSHQKSTFPDFSHRWIPVFPQDQDQDHSRPEWLRIKNISPEQSFSIKSFFLFIILTIFTWKGHAFIKELLSHNFHLNQ